MYVVFDRSAAQKDGKIPDHMRCVRYEQAADLEDARKAAQERRNQFGIGSGDGATGGGSEDRQLVARLTALCTSNTRMSMQEVGIEATHTYRQTD